MGFVQEEILNLSLGHNRAFSHGGGREVKGAHRGPQIHQ